MEFGIFIKQKRIEKGLTSRGMCKLLGKSGSYISNIESGKTKKASLESFYLILSVLEIEDKNFYLKKYGYLKNDEIFDNVEFELQNNEENKAAMLDYINLLDNATISFIYELATKNKKMLKELNNLSKNSNKNFELTKEFIEFQSQKVDKKNTVKDK